MRKKCRVVINDEAFFAERGELLLDAALINGIDIPHDCRSGHCGTCRVNVVSGRVFAGQGAATGAVQACQCRILTDAEFVIEDVPDITCTAGRVAKLVPLAPDFVEVWIETQRPVDYLPGQYLQVQFRKFPVRCYSPTVPLAQPGDGTIRLHVRRLPDGRVSSALGREIRKDHRVKLTGPFGAAYLRPGLSNRLVLVSGGTGFAPIWSIADAALRENSRRDIVMVVGAREIESLYMVPALCRLARCRNVAVVPVVDLPQAVTNVVRVGRPTDHLPTLCADDLVYACGAPPMVETVKQAAAAAGALCYADPFVPQAQDDGGLLSAALSWFRREPQSAPSAAAVAAARQRTPQKKPPRPASRLAEARGPAPPRMPENVRRPGAQKPYRPPQGVRVAAHEQVQRSYAGRSRAIRVEVE